MSANPDVEQELAEDLAGFERDPLGFVQYAYPWGEADLGNSAGPRAWQAEILREIGEHLRNPETRCVPLRVAVASGHGIGKSALVGWVVDWALSTMEDARVKVTANTGDQLTTKTGPEAAKWFRRSINQHWWKIGAEAIKSKDEAHASNWRVDFETWSIDRTEGFAGLHNQGKRIILIFDEASAIPDKIWEVAEGALTDENTEILWLAFGNPTINTGRFRECFGKFSHRWITRQIDSRTVEGTNKAELNKWVEDYGEDSDFVRVRVRGEFPRAGSNQFIPSDAVERARKYKATGFESLPKVMSIDVARFGDDQTVIGLRQGRKLRILAKYRGLDTVQVAERTIEFLRAESPDAIVVDGDGIGAGVVDQLHYRGHRNNVFEFHGAAAANDGNKYFNRRAEVWGLMRDWLIAGAEIPDDPEIDADLTGLEYGFSAKQQIQLERKEDMKKRGLKSPDIADCLAYSFAVDVMAKPSEESQSYQYGSDGWMA